jgi:hypothetical protein
MLSSNSISAMICSASILSQSCSRIGEPSNRIIESAL